MRFRIEQRFGRSVVEVEDTLCDPGFIGAMAQLPKLGRPQLLDHEDTGDIVRMRVRYAFVGELSSAVRRVVDPERLTWVQEQTTDRRTHLSRFTILPDHYSALLRCTGRFAVTPDGDHAALRTADGQIEVSVPLVGGKVERAIVSGLEEHSVAESALFEEWVSSGSG
ncbi:MAG: DUF2505 family protein [Acidimicrobiales bacterium]